jgi:hypothetical protein
MQTEDCLSFQPEYGPQGLRMTRTDTSWILSRRYPARRHDYKRGAQLCAMLLILVINLPCQFPLAELTCSQLP